MRLAALAFLAASPALAQTAPADSAAVPVRTVSDRETPPSFSTDRLLIPVQDVAPGDLTDTYAARRSGGRTHNALDIMAPRGTPALAVADGEVVRITRNRLGGNVLYLRSPDGAYDFYYAHLDGYADGLTVGQTVRQGDVLGFVGTTGNASRTAPHLHFQVLRLDARGRGTPVNPYRMLLGSALYPRGARG